MTLKPPLAVLVLLGVFAWAARDAAACTTFCLHGDSELLFGRNYDWDAGDGLVLINKRGMEKTAMPSDGQRPVHWISRFGSVTFNQYGRELPTGGMNEAGLTVELMWLADTRYAAPDGRPILGALEWIQYQLDRSERVEEVLRSSANLRIVSDARLHYLVCDRTGACATAEILAGRLVAHTGQTLPVPALTNSTYDQSLRFLESAGDHGPGVAGPGSQQRFARAAGLLRRSGNVKGEAAVASAFAILDEVAQGAHTRWSIVYDLNRRRISYRTLANRTIRRLDLAGFDFSCRTPVRMLDIDAGAGDVTRRFVDYRPETNRDLVRRSFQKTAFLAGTPPKVIRAVMEHPAATSCRP
jgi:penicillin V acylase-like amidase (Ntn superfamily)